MHDPVVESYLRMPPMIRVGPPPTWSKQWENDSGDEISVQQKTKGEHNDGTSD